MQPLMREQGDSLDLYLGSAPDDMYIGTDNGNLYRSVGDGQWHREPLAPGDPRVLTITAIWGSSSRNVYVVSVGGTYRGRPAN